MRKFNTRQMNLLTVSFHRLEKGEDETKCVSVHNVLPAEISN